jgi:hypothetical protein
MNHLKSTATLALLTALVFVPAGGAMMLAPRDLPDLPGQPGIIEGEYGTPVDYECASDGESMGAVDMVDASNFAAMFYPESGCSATYGIDALNSVNLIRFTMTEFPGDTTYCGHFAFSGAISGSSQPVCALGGTWIEVPAYTNIGAGGDFTATWVTDATTPTWVNAWLDVMHVGPSLPHGDVNPCDIICPLIE